MSKQQQRILAIT